MAAFQYIALNKNGKRVKGVIEAEGARQAGLQLRGNSLIVLEIKSVSEKEKTTTEKTKRTFNFSRSKRMGASDLSLVTRQLATLLQAGIPLDEVLVGVANQSDKPNVKSILFGVRAKIMEGYGLASGMGDFPHAFPKLYRTTVDSGEKSGNLDQVLNQLAEYTEKQQQIKRKIRQALIYPAMMTIVSIAVIIFMLLFVVPKIIDVFNQTNQVLPLSTKILLLISSGLQKYGYYILGALVLLGYCFKRLLKRDNFRSFAHRVLLKIPLLGKTVRLINASRFARTFGILNAASVPVLESMHAAAQMINILPMRSSVLESIELVREGANIHTALKKAGCFSPMFIHLVGSGESSGQLESMLRKAADNQEADVNAMIDGSLTLFEPIMILVMGSVVMFIVLAVMLPIFALDNFSG